MLLQRQLDASVCATAFVLVLAGCNGQSTEMENTTPGNIATSSRPAPSDDAPTGGTDAPIGASESPVPTAAPTSTVEPPATAAQVPDGWNVVTSTDGAFTAAVPARDVEARKLMEAEDLSATLDDLGVDLDVGEATDMLGQMSMDQVPWFVFDRETLSSGFSDNINILPAGASGGLTADQVLQQLEAAGASFGENPLGPRTVTTVGPYEAVQYDYELPVNGSTVRGRQLFVLADQLYVASQTSTGERFNDNLLAKVAATIQPT